MNRFSFEYFEHHLNSLKEGISSFSAINFNLLNDDQCSLLKLANSYKGLPCFIIGNGPSLKLSDLDQIHNLPAVSIASNRIYLAFPDTKWRPDIYTISDELILETSINEIRKQNLIKLVSNRNKGFLNGDGSRGKTIGFRALCHKPKELQLYNPKPSIDCLKGFFTGQTITTLNIQLAAWLGCTDVFVIGLDGKYQTGQKTGYHSGYGEVLLSEGEQNHFHPDYRPKDELWAIPRTDLHEKEYSACVTLLEKNGIKIYNASRRSAVNAFEKVDTDKAFEMCEKKIKNT